MPVRTIRTMDGQVFSGRCGRFQDERGYVLFKEGLFHKIKINRRGIISDDTSGLPRLIIKALILLILVTLALITVQNWPLY